MPTSAALSLFGVVSIHFRSFRVLRCYRWSRKFMSECVKTLKKEDGIRKSNHRFMPKTELAMKEEGFLRMLKMPVRFGEGGC
jgi:hypothetical protein